MKRAVTVASLYFVLVFARAGPSASSRGRFWAAGLKDDEVEAFFLSFKDAIAREDKKKVAGMLSYPVRVTFINGRQTKLHSPSAFIKACHRIFDDQFKSIIAATEPRNLFAKTAGVATPRGEIWFTGIVKRTKPRYVYEIKIITLNGPIRS